MQKGGENEGDRTPKGGKEGRDILKGERRSEGGAQNERKAKGCPKHLSRGQMED